MKQSAWLLLAALLAAPALAQTTVGVTVNGQAITFDQPPMVQDGRVLVPLRGVFERLGATVTYNAADHSVLAQTPSTHVSLLVGSTQATVNDHTVSLDSAPITVGARVLVPLRFVSEALGATVAWDSGTRLVAITGAAGMPPSVTYAPPAPPEPPPAPAAAHIERVVLDAGALPQHPLWVGNVLDVSMYGSPGGRADFDINGQTGFAMHETSPGVYRGRYVVRESDMNRHATVTCHLSLDEGPAAVRRAADVVSLDGRSREEEAKVSPLRDRLIFQVVHNGTAVMTQGQELRVRMTAAAHGMASFDVGGRHGIPMTEVTPGTYEGTYLIRPEDNEPQARVVAHLTMSDGEHDTRVAQPSVALEGSQRY